MINTQGTAGFGDIPEKYANLPRMSSSSLIMFRKSPRHFHLKKKKPKTKTAEFGNKFHLALLEPDRWADIFILKPDFPAKSKSQPLTIKEQEEIWLEQNQGKFPVTEKDLENIREMLDSCAQHDTIPYIMKRSTKLIENFWWQVKETVDEQGQVHEYLMCGYCDIVLPELGLVLDVKTTGTASKDEWDKHVYKMNYHIQAAVYLDAMTAIFEKPFQKYVWIAVENTWPWNASTYFADDAQLDTGASLIKKTIPLWLACRAADKWPGYNMGLVPSSLPNYALYKYQEEELEPNGN